MSEYEQLARGAEARSEWSANTHFHGSILHNHLIDKKGNAVARFENLQDMQFILDAIRLLPQLVRELQEAKARVQAVGKWESVENPPPFIRSEQVLPNGEIEWLDIKEGDTLPVSVDIDYFSQPLLLQVEAVGCFYGYDGTNGEIETRFEIDESKAIGWRYLKERDEK